MLGTLILAAGLAAGPTPAQSVVPPAINALVDRALRMGKERYAVQLCVCLDDMPKVDRIIEDLRIRVKGAPSSDTVEDLTLVWGAYIGDVVRRAHREARWQDTPRRAAGRYWVQLHKADEPFDPFPIVARVLSTDEQRTPLSAVVGLAVLDCHLE